MTRYSYVLSFNIPDVAYFFDGVLLIIRRIFKITADISLENLGQYTFMMMLPSIQGFHIYPSHFFTLIDTIANAYKHSNLNSSQ